MTVPMGPSFINIRHAPQQAGHEHMAAATTIASVAQEAPGHAAMVHAMPLIDHFAAVEMSHMAHAAAAAVAHG